MRVAILLTCLLTACSQAETTSAPTATISQPPTIQTQGNTMKIIANNQEFTVELDNTAAAQELRIMLPLSFNMTDHLHNEKFAVLPRSLPTQDFTPKQIMAGDVLLFQGNTLVIFYENHSSTYRYTRIGKIQNAGSLKAALGSGDIVVRWVQ